MSDPQTLPMILRNSPVAGAVPASAEFNLNTFVFNSADGKLYWKDSQGNIIDTPLFSSGKTISAASPLFAGLTPIEAYVASGEDPTVDVGPALRRAATALGTGGRVTMSKTYRLATPVPNLSNFLMTGVMGKPSIPGKTEDPTQRRSTLVIAASAFAPDGNGNPTAPAFPNFGTGAAMRFMNVFLEGLGLPWANAAAARTGIAKYKGQVFGLNNTTNDVDISDNIFCGFNQVMDGYLGGGGRIHVYRNLIDCNGGFRIYASLDTCRSQDNQAWPFLSVYCADTTANNDVLMRPGVAYAWDGRADGSVSINDLAFGYKKNFYVRDCPAFRLIAPWSDHGNPLTSDQIGIHFLGNCGSAEIHAPASVACQSTLTLDTGFNQGTYGNGTGATPLGNPVRVFGGNLNGAQYGLDLVTGESFIDGVTFDGGQHVNVRAGIIATAFSGCTFARGGGIATPDDATRAKVKVSNNCRFVDGTAAFDDWFTYTPAVSAPSGSGVTFGSPAGEYRKGEGRMVDVRAQVTITAGGSGGGAVRIPLPFAAVGNFNQHLHGAREGVGGEVCKVVINPNASYADVYLYNNGTAIATNAFIQIDGRYKANI